MSVSVGIGLAFVAMLCRGFGDFLIQKSTRKIGDWEALFFITLFGAVVLFPFAYKKLPAIFAGPSETLIVLGVLCVVLFFAAILDFEALRVGKLAVVEPIWSFEVPVSALLAFFILAERLSLIQILLIAALLVGLALVSLKDKFKFSKISYGAGHAFGFFRRGDDGRGEFFYGLEFQIE